MTTEQRFLDDCRAKGIEVVEGPRKPIQAAPRSRLHLLWVPKWRPATCNQLMRTTVGKRIRLAKQDREMVCFYAQQQGIERATGKRRVSLEIVLEGRQREADEDAYKKSTYDSLVHAGLLRGDTVHDVESGKVRYSRFGQAGTRILLEDL